jgi:hydrogenase/urease accessory protein HupE
MAILAAFATFSVRAHESRPLYVQLTETDPGVFSAYWKVPTSMPRAVVPSPMLPDGCIAEDEPVMQSQSDAFEFQQRFGCEQGLSGRTIGVHFPVMNPSITTLLQIRLANGEQHVRVLRPGVTTWVVPERESALAVAGEYTVLGIEHIWIGLDHLLFVACLLFVARTARRLLITITGFTVAHSLTLALSALDLVRVPVPPVEAAIALSVVFLAYEIAGRNESSLTFRFPIAVSVSFGLLHGFGFAAVLREIGLPQTELPNALLFFNIGVEIGQILFVLALVAIYLVLRPFLRRLSGRSEPIRVEPAGSAATASLAPAALTVPAAYLIGGLATYWMIDRISGFWL